MIKVNLVQALNERFTQEDFLLTLQSNNIEKKFVLALQIILKTDKSQFGFQLLNGLDLSKLIDEEFIKDLLIDPSISSSSSSSQLNFLKLVYLVSKVDHKMAIQKHLSTYTAQNKVENSENLDIGQLIKIIEYIFEQEHEIPQERLIEISKMIIREMSKTPLPRDAKELKIIRPDILKIGQFFAKLVIPNEERLHFLEFIYDLLSNPTNNPTSLLSLGLLVIPEKMIQCALEFFFSNIQWNRKITKESILITMERLIYWLRTTHMPVPLDVWIIKIIVVLNTKEMHEIVNEIAKKNIAQAFLSLLVPLFQSKTFPVVKALLENSSNTKELVNLIAGRIINVLKNLESTTSEIFEPLMVLICNALGVIDHIENEAQFKEIINFLELRNCPLSKIVVKKKFTGLSSYDFLTSNNARVGLQNLGNTCYLNSILQALFMTKQFCREIITTQRNDNAIIELQKLFALMLCSPRPEQNPKTVVNLIRPDDFLAGIQHDSSEFLCSLLDRLHEKEKKRLKEEDDEDWDAEPNNPPSLLSVDAAAINPVIDNIVNENQSIPMDVDVSNKKGNLDNVLNSSEVTRKDKIVDNTSKNIMTHTYIQKIFGGKICTRYLCKTCNSNSINIDSFRDLQLSFPEQSQDENNEMQYNVQQLLEYYFSTEELNILGDNQYHCDNCRILCNGVRCTEILEPPKNLILTLKHFRYDSRHHTRSKLLYKVFHEEFITVTVKGSLESNSTTNTTYKLYAAVIHSGNSLDNGHYYTIAREDDSRWFKFNDSFVTKSSLEELRGLISPNTPYILFYQRLSTSTASATVVHPEGTVASASIYSPKNADSFPDYQELSTFLKDYINEDKLKYENDIAMQRNMSYGKLYTTVRNNYDDNNDPGTGSSYNFDQDFKQNRYIF